MSDYEKFLETKTDNFRMSDHHYFAKHLAIEHGFKQFNGDQCRDCGSTLRYANADARCVCCMVERDKLKKERHGLTNKQLSSAAWC